MYKSVEFTQWVSAELAELEAQINDGGLWSCYLSDKVRILQHALRHGDEMKYELDMVSLIESSFDSWDGDSYRWEELTLDIKQRDAAIAAIAEAQQEYRWRLFPEVL